MKTAYATMEVIEVTCALRKGQASMFYYGDPLSEMRLARRVFYMRALNKNPTSSPTLK